MGQGSVFKSSNKNYIMNYVRKAGDKLIEFWQNLSGFGKVGLVVLLCMVVLAVGAPLFTWLPHITSSGPPLVPPAGSILWELMNWE